MSSRLDELLAREGADAQARPGAGAHAGTLERARAAARAELLASRTVRSWRRELGLFFGAVAGLGVAIVAGGWLGGAASPELLAARAPGFAALIGVAALGAYVVTAPRGGALRFLFPAVAAVAALVLGFERVRHGDAPSSFPEWGCTVSHVLTGIAPVIVALWAYRSAAPFPWRAWTAGMTAGTVGLIMGEVACERGLPHLIVFHFGAWAVVTAMAWLGSRLVKPKTYAA